MMATRTNTCFMREAIFALVISFKSISFIMGLVIYVTKVIHLDGLSIKKHGGNPTSVSFKGRKNRGKQISNQVVFRANAIV